MNESKCSATRGDGLPCGARALPGGEMLCWAHSPSLAAKRRRAHTRGGQNKATGRRAEKLMPATLRRDFERLGRAMDLVAEGTLPPRVGTALAALAVARLKVFEGALLEVRIDAIERQMGRDARIG